MKNTIVNKLTQNLFFYFSLGYFYFSAGLFSYKKIYWVSLTKDFKNKNMMPIIVGV